METSYLIASQLGVIVLLSAILRGVTGFGFAIAAVPAMSFLIEPSSAVVLIALLQMLIGVRDVPALRHQVDGPSLKWLGVGALVGTPGGVYMLAQLDPALTKMIIAAIFCVALPVLLSPKGVMLKAGPLSAIPAGFASGFFGGLAAMPGPPAIIYFVASRFQPAQTRASLMIFFFLTSLISLPAFYFSGLITIELMILSALGLPIFYLGGWIGEKLFEKTSDKMYKNISIALLFIMALATGYKGYVEFF